MTDSFDDRAARARAELAGAVRADAATWPSAGDLRRIAIRRHRARRAAVPIVLLLVAAPAALATTGRHSTRRSTVLADRPATGTESAIPPDGETATSSRTGGPGNTAPAALPSPGAVTTTTTKVVSAAEGCAGPAPALDRSGLWVIPPAGPAVNLYDAGDTGKVSDVTRSPDGHRLAFFVTNDDSGNADLMIADRQETKVVSHEARIGTVSWAPDGEQLVVVSQVRGSSDPSDVPTRLEVVGLDGRHTTIWERPSTTHIGAVIPHPDGNHVLFIAHDPKSTRYDDGTLAEIALDGSGYRELLTNASPTTPLVVSPDRGSVAAVAGGQRVVIDLAAGTERVIASSPAGTASNGFRNLIDSAIGWSPDGRWVAYVHGGGYYGATVTLYPLADADAKPIEFSLPGNDSGESYRGVTFSADSRHAIAVQRDPADPVLVTIDLSNRARHVVIEKAWHLVPIGDNLIVAAVANPGTRMTLCRMHTDGSNPTPVLGVENGIGLVVRDYGSGGEPMIRPDQGLNWHTTDNKKSAVVYTLL